MLDSPREGVEGKAEEPDKAMHKVQFDRNIDNVETQQLGDLADLRRSPCYANLSTLTGMATPYPVSSPPLWSHDRLCSYALQLKQLLIHLKRSGDVRLQQAFSAVETAVMEDLDNKRLQAMGILTNTPFDPHVFDWYRCEIYDEKIHKLG